MPELAGGLLDDRIYSRDREFRLPGATKVPNGNPKQPPLDQYDTWRPGTAYIATGHSIEQGMVGYLGSYEPHVLALPTADRSAAAPRAASARSKGPPPGLSLDDGQARMLQLISRQHPTVYMMHLADTDVFDRDKAARFNHSDRSEQCWCGKAHHSNNYKAWFSGNDAWVYCFACKQQFAIGCLEDNFAAPDDIEVHCRWLTRMQECESTEDPHLTKLNEQLTALLTASIKVLCLQSVMGSGKTTLLKSLITELAQRLGVQRVLIITYRQSLSLNMLAELGELGFINYLHAQQDKIDLTSQDRAIVQLDSIAKVCKGGKIIPKFDLVVLDENESTLHHTTAKTHGSKQGHTFQTFCSIIKAADRVLVMDAFLGAETRAFLKSLGLTYRFVRNTWRPEPRTFKLTNDEAMWTDKMCEALLGGRNVALPCMSSRFMHRLRAYLVDNGILKADEVLLYDAETDDEIKRQVQNVNELWVRYRLVMWSPSVESGVNFDVKGHFHCMFLVMCSGANTPLGVMQMTGRVRHLGCQIVLTFCSHLSMNGQVQPWTPADAAHFFRWADDLQHPEGFNAQFNLREEQLDSGATALLPTHDTALVVAAHNYARIMNSKSNFLMEWVKLVEHAGHRYDTELWRWGKQKRFEESLLPEYDRNRVLLAARPVSSEEANQLLVLQLSGQATREQKESLARYFYCKSWGISNQALDESFLEHHPAYDDEATPLQVLHATLAAPRKGFTRLCEDGREMACPVVHRAKVLRELMQALQITNVLDSAANSCTLTPGIWEAVKECKAFSSPDNIRQTEQLFGLDHSTSGFKDLGHTAHRIALLFRCAGLKAEVEKGKRKQVNKVRIVPYKLRFGTPVTIQTAELFKLKYMWQIACNRESQWANAALQQYLVGLKVVATGKYMLHQQKHEDYLLWLQPDDSL